MKFYIKKLNILALIKSIKKIKSYIIFKKKTRIEHIESLDCHSTRMSGLPMMEHWAGNENKLRRQINSLTVTTMARCPVSSNVRENISIYVS